MEYTVTEEEPVSGSDERLARLEERMSGLSEDMSDLKQSNRSIAESLKMLAILEERHRTSDEAMKRIFEIIEKNMAKIEAIEIQMPNLSLASSWVFRAVLAIMALTGITYLTMILRGAVKP